MIDLLLQQFLKKKTRANSKKAAVRTPDEDFIPYVCHYDPNTILTKNGELLQIIRITGFSNSSVISELVSLREAVREAIINHATSNKVAFWFNTIRRKKNIVPRGTPQEIFAKKFDEAWTKENKWDDQYVNELYITIIVEGLDTSIENLPSFLRSFSYMATKSLHTDFLQKAHKKLSELVNGIILDTQEYGAKLLGLNEHEGVLYSGPMRFFGKITNLFENRYPLAANDISLDLSSHKIAFGNRELEVLGDSNKNFAAMLSLKEYFEVSTDSLDNILQLPCEFIITQSFDFTFDKKDLEPYEYQNYLLQVSGDEDFRQISGIADFVESNKQASTDYGKLQTTIMIISHSLEELERDVEAAFEKFNALGFVVVREDVFSEHCFWSQLPANFRYLRRQKIINTNHIGGFAALHNFSTGLIGGNKWGPAVATLKTILNTPYFFNFHDRDLGHTLILGSLEFEETTLTNFLITQSRRINSRLFYFDFNNSAKCLIKALSGKYYDMSVGDEKSPEFLHLNPLSLPNNDHSKSFLINFFTNLVFSSGDNIPKSEIDFIPEIVSRILISKASNFSLASESFNLPETQNIYKTLRVWNGENLGHIFGSETEISWSDKITAFDLSEALEEKPILIPIFNYLLRQIEESLDGSPAILVLNNAWSLLDNPILGPNISETLQRFNQKNCAVIMASRNINQISESQVSSEINKNLATKVFLPNPNPDSCLQNIFGLSEDEMKILQMMSEEDEDFFFKHSDDAIIASLRLSKLAEFKKVFNPDLVSLTALKEVLAAYDDENLKPEDWLDQFLEILRELEKEAILAKKEALRKSSAERKIDAKEKLNRD